MADSTRVQLSARTLVPERAHLRTADGLGPFSALSIALDSRANSWRLRVHAELAPASTWRVGELLVPPPLTPSEGTRVVAVCCCPGAVGWVVDALPYVSAVPPYDTADPLEKGYLEIAAADVGMIEMGIHPVGRTELIGARKNYQSGTMAPGNSQVTVPADRKIQRVSAWQVGVGGIFGIEAYIEAVPIPPNGAASVQVDRFGTGAGAVWFVGIPAGGGGYVIEFLE